MYKKLVGIVVFGLLITTALPAVGTLNEKEKTVKLGLCGNSSNEMSIHNTMMNGAKGSLFMQLPNGPANGEWMSGVSDLESGWKIYDDFWEVSGPICDIHWWGQCLKYTYDWFSYVPTGMVFNIEFYVDDNGKPGALVCSYENITPPIIETGIMYSFGDIRYFDLYYFETVLEPCCDMSDGWISIQSTYVPSGGWFMWINSDDGNLKVLQQNEDDWTEYDFDMSFILTDGEPDVSDLECEGELRWTDVRPGKTVFNHFQVRNNGDTDSILHWKIDETTIPDWGVDWAFSPNASIFTTDMDWVTVDVQVTSPDTQGNYSGKIKIINVEDEDGDYCEIDVYLNNPRSRTLYDALFLRLFERFPNAFPILRQLLGFL